MKRIMPYEPWFFIFFGVFHLHRVWGLVDRDAYSDFWINVMEQRGLFYYLIMGVLAIQCIIGIATLTKNLHHNYRWRWIYLFGGGYVLFDLFAIATEQVFWKKLILKMFDVNFAYWNELWTAFIILGAASFVLGIVLLFKVKKDDDF
ncbi:putative membrane protein [Peptoniphilus sp. ING2-D1G]|nr:putative membrane protein [Peptoniphilus sp. ING2-D1G]